MKPHHSLILVILTFALALRSQATQIDISDISLVPDGSTTTEVLQTEITPLNGGSNVLPNTNGTVVYTITTFTFGADSNAHIQCNFNATGGQNRLGVQVQDTGQITFVSQNDPGDTSVNMGDLSGQSVTLLIKQHYDTSNDALRNTNGTGDDTLMTVWVNPDNADVEGSGIAAGDMHTLWNSNTYRYYTHSIQNQSTPGTGGTSFITATTILTGADATWANALALATGSTPPTGIVDAETSTVSALPTAVPADGTSAATITVTLKEAGGNPVAGKEVSLSGDGSASITTGDNISDANGEVTFTVKSSTVGVEEFTATDVTDSNLVITETASVNFQEVVPIGPVDAGNSTVVGSASTIPANGIAISTITVTLKDSNGALIVGEGVTLAGNPAGTSISPVGAQSTDSNGQAIFSVASTNIGTVTFSATSSTNSTIVSQTVAVEFVDPATASAYNVNFIDDGQSDEPGLIGVVGEPVETWNQGTTSVSNLVDSTGAIVSAVSVSGLSSSGRPISGATLGVFKANRDVFAKGADITISITGLTPDTAYDLYIYALSHNTTSWGDISNTERAAGDFITSNTVLGNGQSQFLDNAVAGTNGNSFVYNGNYVVFQSIVTDGSGDISILVDAYDGLDGSSATNDGDCRLHVNGLQIRPASGMSVDYMNWRSAYFPGIGLPGEDDDGDGLSNEYEQTFGLDPTDPASSNPYSTVLDAATGHLGYTRRAKSLINMNYKVWYSVDLNQWFEDNAANQIVESVTNDVETMSVDIDQGLLEEPKLFCQVRATPTMGVDPEPSLINLWGSGDTITLLFSEPMNTFSATNPNHYTVEQDGGGVLGISDVTLSSDGGSVTLTLASTLGIDANYTVNIDGVTSGTGQSLGGLVSRQFRTWDDDPTGIKVFILGGQSNMVGFGEVEGGSTNGTLRYLAENNASYPEYDYTSLLEDPGQPASSAFVSRSDVKVWWRDGGNGNLGGAISKGDLGPPYKGRDSGKIGPEFAFGHIIGDYYVSGDVLIIKTAWGGRSLGGDFRPPSAVALRGGQVGPFYNAIIDNTREVLNNLGTEFPEWAGRGYQIVGFGWHQGYNDRIDASFSAEYAENLTDLISDVREVFDKPNMPFVIATTGMGNVGAVEAAPYTGYTAVEKAQLWASGVVQPANVLSSDTRGFWRDSTVSPSDQGHHWNFNAESYFLVGKALGDNMVNLLTP